MAVHVIHTSCYVPGLLSMFKSDIKLKKVLTLEASEKKMTGKQLRAYLEEQVKEGNVYLPMTECPTFDPRVGCQCSKKEIEEAKQSDKQRSIPEDKQRICPSEQ